MTDTVELNICGKCGFPIERGETGIRAFGTYQAHEEPRCFYLLKAHAKERDATIERLERERDEAVAVKDIHINRSFTLTARAEAAEAQVRALTEAVRAFLPWRDVIEIDAPNAGGALNAIDRLAAALKGDSHD